MAAIVRRLVETIWAQAKAYWTPLEAMPPVPLTDLDMPRLKGQIGFRPRTTLLPPAGIRSSR